MTGSRWEIAVRVLVAAGLAVDAVVHVRLAGAMAIAAPGGIGGDTLFRAQAAAAAVAALVLLVTGARLAYLLAGLVALAALGAVLLYTFVPVPDLGPVPSMYDPTWSTGKVASAVAEAVAVVLSPVGAALRRVSAARASDLRDDVPGPRRRTPRG